MPYSPEQISFILYNNRSVEGTVSHFIREMRPDPNKLTQIEKMLSFCSRMYSDEQTVAIDSRELNLESEDVTVTPQTLHDCHVAVIESHQKLLQGGPEMEWLEKRGITHRMARANKLGSLSHIQSNFPEALTPLGITIHPMLKPILDDSLEGGGILIPLFDEKFVLKNCTVRRIADVGKLKYTQACPDIDVWGLQGSGEYWVAEGLFDAMAIRTQNVMAASVSSAMWSGPQLLRLLQKATSINIFADDDRVGLRSAAVLQRFFGMCGLPCRTYVSEDAKDAAEHILEKGKGLDKLKEISITKDMIASAPDMTFNFTKYLKDRRF